MSEGEELLTLSVGGANVTATRAEWDDVMRQIVDHHVAARKAHEARQRAAGQVWTLEVCNCGDGRGDWTEEAFSEEEFAQCVRTWFESDASIRSITAPGGVSVDVGYENLALISNRAPD